MKCGAHSEWRGSTWACIAASGLDAANCDVHKINLEVGLDAEAIPTT
ncbi:MAG: hypothetical protein CM1200mP24_08930 [Gammaproteobacteria bacterium]|nr:MAG: hypothetical protein CM1200mP24_08930 [Gammaproteobacteria bacterium]